MPRAGQHTSYYRKQLLQFVLLLLSVVLNNHSCQANSITDYLVNLQSSDFLPWLKEEIEELKEDAESWKNTYRNNLEALQQVAPFVNSTMGSFQQNFEGKWAAVDTEDPRLIEEAFEKSEGWAKLTFVVESFDMKTVNQTQIDQIREHLGPDAFASLNFTDTDEEVSQQQEDKQDIFNKDFPKNITNLDTEIVKRAEKLSNDTIVTKIYVIVQLFDQNYIDDSIEISFIKYIEGHQEQKGNFIDTEQRRLQFDTQNLTITSKDLQEPTKTRNCELSAQLSVIEIDPANITDNMTDGTGASIKERLENKEFIDSSDQILNHDRKLFLIDLEIESTWATENLTEGVDHDSITNLQTAEQETLDQDDTSGKNSTVIDEGTCFPKKIIAQFTNTKDSSWFDRFTTYSNVYLIVSIFAICASSFQKHKLNKIIADQPERINSLALGPLIVITAWSLASLFFHLILAVGLMRSEILSQIIHLVIFVFVFTTNYRLTMLALKHKISMKHKRACIYLIYLLGVIFLVWGRQLIVNDAWMFVVFGPIWIQQIVNNLLARKRMQPEFHFNLSFLILQSIHFMFIPAYTRGFSENFYFLKPHDGIVKASLISVGAQMILLRLMCITYEGMLAKLNSRRRCNICRLLPQRIRRAIRRWLIKKIQRQNQRKQGLNKIDIYLYWRPFSNLYKLRNASKEFSSGEDAQSNINDGKVTANDATLADIEEMPQQKPQIAKQQSEQHFCELTDDANNLDSPNEQDNSGGSSSPKSPGNSFECPICLCSLKYEPTELDIEGKVKDPSAQKKCNGYLETPCKHMYHRSCILRWFQSKQECPECRTKLPPVQPYDGQFDSDDGE